MGSSAQAQEEQSAPKTLGIADVGSILKHYRRAEQTKAYIERATISDEQRRIRKELAELERESAQRGFWFIRRREANEELEAKRSELREVAQRDSENARVIEAQAVGGLMVEIQMAVESAGRDEDLAAVFDSAQPHILYVNSGVGMVTDLTNRTIKRLNSQ